tara:strand:- start:1434 stop:1610 length:177 start_codon:yes stop_codon:yes gene_type:complete
MSSWTNRDKKNNSRRNSKSLDKPFRKVVSKDSKQARDWSKTKKKLKRFQDQETEDTIL